MTKKIPYTVFKAGPAYHEYGQVILAVLSLGGNHVAYWDLARGLKGTVGPTHADHPSDVRDRVQYGYSGPRCPLYCNCKISPSDESLLREIARSLDLVDDWGHLKGPLLKRKIEGIWEVKV